MEAARKECCQELHRVRQVNGNLAATLRGDVFPDKVDLSGDVGWVAVSAQVVQIDLCHVCLLTEFVVQDLLAPKDGEDGG